MAARQRAERQDAGRHDAGRQDAGRPHDGLQPAGRAQAGHAGPPPAPHRRARPERLAFALSLAWLVLVVALAWLLARRGMPPAEMLVFVLIALAVFLPVVLIWQLVYLLRAAARMETAAQVLALQADALARRASVAGAHALRGGVTSSGGAAGSGGGPPSEMAGDGGATLRFASRRHEPPPAGPGAANGAANGTANGAGESPSDQASLALAAPAGEAVDIGHDELIRALHFPEDEHDSDGFAALRRALGNHATAELIRSAQAVLTGLALEGIYMDRLTPEPPRAEIWRAFAGGERGPVVAAMGGLRDRSCLALSAARMRSDLEFREAVHRFLRAFERCLRAFEPDAGDDQLIRLADTRSGRAFMLLGRVSGVFR